MSVLDPEQPLKNEPRDGASVRRKRKLLILKYVARFPEGVHEENICARLDMITGLTHYRLKVYIHELDRGGWLDRSQNGMCKLVSPLETVYAKMFATDPEIEVD